MVVQYLETFDKSLVKKKHRHILELMYSLIALCAIIWAIAYIQTRSAQRDVVGDINSYDRSSGLTPEEFERKVSLLEESESSTPVSLTAEEINRKKLLLQEGDSMDRVSLTQEEIDKKKLQISQ